MVVAKFFVVGEDKSSNIVLVGFDIRVRNEIELENGSSIVEIITVSNLE